METDLSKLPPPPKGQVGIQPTDLSKLPAPPKQGGGLTLQQIIAQKNPTAPAPKPSILGKVADTINSSVAQASQPLQDAGTAIAKDMQTPTTWSNLFPKTENAIKNITGGVVGAIASPIQQAIQAISDANAKYNPVVKAVAGNKVVGAGLDAIDSGLQRGVTAYNTLKTAHPDLAQHLETTGNLVNFLMLGLAPEVQKQLGPAIEDVTGSVKSGIDSTVQGAKDLVTKNPAEQLQKQVQSSIEAVNPDLTGKKLVSGYKQVVTGGREVTPSSIFKEQGLTPDQQTVNLGTRLQDLNLGKDHVENLQKLGTALTDTETKLNTALKGDPEVNYSANKPELISKLDTAKSQIPREFSSIKDSKSVFNNVIDFAKEMVKKSEDSIIGLRDGRTSFDAQAKAEYPSAFKEGKIDTSTPAGRAIKTARDIYSQHLYDTAPNGSEIQKLIGREADIFRATDNIAPKAVSGHGESVVVKLKSAIKSHPYVAGSVGLGADKLLKALTGIGF